MTRAFRRQDRTPLATVELFLTRALRGVVALAVVATCFSCSSRSSPTAPVETPVPPPSVTESISGSFGQGETSCHQVNVIESGALRVTLLGLDPVETGLVGIGLGRPGDAASCTLFAQDPTVRIGDTLLSDELDPGPYCVCVYDAGNVVAGATVAYDALVEHP